MYLKFELLKASLFNLLCKEDDIKNCKIISNSSNKLNDLKNKVKELDDKINFILKTK